MEKSKRKIYNPPLLKFISLATISYFIYYLWWRATDTLNPDRPFISWMLWGAEAFGVFSFLLFAWITRDIAPAAPHKYPPGKLKVDIFIPTYNEDVEILEATLTGCNRILYPHKTYVLDDGDRPQVKALADRMGCGYITRPVHTHAKAGNINHALLCTDGEFIAILDADMVPQPEYLERTLGYFEDEKLALVQLPQEFYNWDSIQHASEAAYWHEQSLFFRVIQPGKNYSNSAFWCGSPSVVRRRALGDIGGVATETITEDIHSTVRLHSRGWRTLYVNEPLAFGIAPQTIKAFLLQRLRWAQGTMQLYRSKESPLWIPGLTWRQRLSYLSSFLAYFESFQKVVLIVMPVLILGFDLLPMRVGVIPFILHWTPYFAFNILANQAGGRGVFQYFKTEKYNILKSIVFIQSTLTLLSRESLKFKVTPKTVDDTVYRGERKSMLGYMTIFGALIGSMLFALIKFFLPRSEPVAWDAFAIAFFWAGYNALVIFSALREVFRKRHDRKTYRFRINAGGRLYGVKGCLPFMNVKVVDLSVTGVGFLADAKLPEDSQNLLIKIAPPGFKEIILPVGQIRYQRDQHSGKVLMGSSFPDALGPQRERLFEYLFIRLPKVSDLGNLYRFEGMGLFKRIQSLTQKAIDLFRSPDPASESKDYN